MYLAQVYVMTMETLASFHVLVLTFTYLITIW